MTLPSENPQAAAVIFGATGGVLEAALRTAADWIAEHDLQEIDFKAVRGLDRESRKPRSKSADLNSRRRSAPDWATHAGFWKRSNAAKRITMQSKSWHVPRLPERRRAALSSRRYHHSGKTAGKRSTATMQDSRSRNTSESFDQKTV